MTKQVALWVNGESIELDYFVLGFIDHTLDGILAALEGTGAIKTLDLSIGEDEQVTIN